MHSAAVDIGLVVVLYPIRALPADPIHTITTQAIAVNDAGICIRTARALLSTAVLIGLSAVLHIIAATDTLRLEAERLTGAADLPHACDTRASHVAVGGAARTWVADR